MEIPPLDMPPWAKASTKKCPAELQALPVNCSKAWTIRASNCCAVAGQGEWANDPFAVVGFGSEQEIPLAPGAPVRVKRVRINSPDHGWKNWHDLVVHPHMRYASAPLPPRPQNTGTTPEQLYRLASSWGISHPERYGLPLRPPPPPPPAPVAVRRPGPAILTVAERYS